MGEPPITPPARAERRILQFCDWHFSVSFSLPSKFLVDLLTVLEKETPGIRLRKTTVLREWRERQDDENKSGG
jgi:hypothetical protein